MAITLRGANFNYNESPLKEFHQRLSAVADTPLADGKKPSEKYHAIFFEDIHSTYIANRNEERMYEVLKIVSIVAYGIFVAATISLTALFAPMYVPLVLAVDAFLLQWIVTKGYSPLQDKEDSAQEGKEIYKRALIEADYLARQTDEYLRHALEEVVGDSRLEEVLAAGREIYPESPARAFIQPLAQLRAWDKVAVNLSKKFDKINSVLRKHLETFKGEVDQDIRMKSFVNMQVLAATDLRDTHLIIEARWRAVQAALCIQHPSTDPSNYLLVNPTGPDIYRRLSFASPNSFGKVFAYVNVPGRHTSAALTYRDLLMNDLERILMKLSPVAREALRTAV